MWLQYRMGKLMVRENKMNELYEEMKLKTPVDTGELKESYKFEKVDDFEYKISNNAKHAHQILALGRVGKQGSQKLPDGILPFVSSFVSKN